MTNTLSITRPDDWHVHFRDQDALDHTVKATAMHFRRALAMPNLQPALTSVTSVLAYRERIIKAIPADLDFTPYMTLYLNEKVPLAELTELKKYPMIVGAKLYPAGATTNAEDGASSIHALYPLLDLMQELDLVLQIHGEVTHSDIFEREALFIEEYLLPLTQNFPGLRVVLEHISTKAAVDFVKNAGPQVAATITPHHLMYNRNHLLAGGIRPHYYCLPILKHKKDQMALQAAAVSGDPKFFAGTDSAPHAKSSKESACGCAGIYSAPYALALYAEMFDSLGKLHQLNAFMGHFGAQFYHLPISNDLIELVKKPQIIPASLMVGQDPVIPVAAGSTLHWSIHESA